MSCKSCNAPFSMPTEQQFCHACGAKIVTKRLNVKAIVSDFFEHVVDWDNSFLRTLKTLALKPELILKEYMGGVRKKYMNPLSFFVLSASLYLLIINLLGEAYFQFMTETNEYQFNGYKELGMLGPEEIKKAKADGIVFTKFFLQYYTIIMAVIMPIFSLFTYIIFRKPYNYAEHIVCNYYIYGFVLYFSIVFTLLGFALKTHELMYIPMLMVVFVYMYSFKRLYKLSVFQIILKFILFLCLLVALFIFIVIIGVLFAVIKSKFT